MRYLSLPDDYRQSSATGGNQISLADTQMAADAANFWNGGQVYIPTFNDARRVASFNANTLYMVPTLSATVPSGTEYEVCKDWRAEEVHDEIDRAIMEVANVMMATRIDTTLTKNMDELRYNVPSGFVNVAELWYKSTVGTGATYDKWDEIDSGDWDILRETTPVLVFNHRREWANVNGKQLRLVGQTVPSRMTTNTQQAQMNPEWIIQHSIMNLAGRRSVGGENQDQYKAMYMLARQAVERLRPLMNTAALPGARTTVEY